jgi:hypothetical protein
MIPEAVLLAASSVSFIAGASALIAGVREVQASRQRAQKAKELTAKIEAFEGLLEGARAEEGTLRVGVPMRAKRIKLRRELAAELSATPAIALAHMPASVMQEIAIIVAPQNGTS